MSEPISKERAVTVTIGRISRVASDEAGRLKHEIDDVRESLHELDANVKREEDIHHHHGDP